MGDTMGHRHFRDWAVHHWDCSGLAARPYAGSSEPTLCRCLNHDVLLEDGDHSQCPVELLACPEHRDAQLRGMNTPDMINLLERQINGGSGVGSMDDKRVDSPQGGLMERESKHRSSGRHV